jgi:hypothetical protein
LLLVACAREQRVVPDAAGAPAPSVSLAPSPHTVALDDTCKRHDDCVPVDLFIDGPLRCCIACGARAAANKSSADAFIAACAKERATRECPVYPCDAEVLDVRCVARHCQLAPRPR